MNQNISNVLMHPTDAVEHLTLVEKLEKLSDEYFNLYAYYGDGVDLDCSGAVDEAINIVKQHSEWISADERLPSDGDIVEVYRNSYKWGDLVWQCLYTDKHSFRNYPAGTVGKNDKITHWRPIQPPSEVQDAT